MTNIDEESLGSAAREAVDLLSHYYRRQIAYESERLPEILAWVRRSCSCLALANELATETREQLLGALYGVASTSGGDESMNVAAALERLSQERVLALWNRQRPHVEALDSLPEYEQLRHGDQVEVTAPTRGSLSSYGEFVRYTDPRIGNPKRRALVLPSGGDLVFEVPPERLRFAPCVETYAERYDHLRIWRQNGFELQLYDTGSVDHHGKAVLAFEFRDWLHEHGNYPLFHGNDFHCSPLHAVDSDATVASLLSFISLRPGDTAAEYFATYTPRHLEWCEERAEDLLLCVEALSHDP